MARNLEARLAITPAQLKALFALEDCSGEGVLDKNAILVAAGRRLKFMPETWLRLLTTGHCESRGPMRIGITEAGRAEIRAAQAIRSRVNPSLIHRQSDGGRVQPHDGAE